MSTDDWWMIIMSAYVYLASIVAVSVWLRSLWFPKGGFWTFVAIACVVGAIHMAVYNYIEQLRRHNDILEGEFQRKIQKETNRLQVVEQELQQKEQAIENVLKEKELELVTRESALTNLVSEKSKGFPFLANAYADFVALRDEEVAWKLSSKKHPAYTAAEAIRQIKLEKRALSADNKKLKYIMEYYETLFPWLVDLKDIENDELTDLVFDHAEQQPTEDGAKKWLSDSEYKNKSNTEKYQLALDRYLGSQKSKWQIGRDFERYVGYTFEKQGFSVEYKGILSGFEDLGRDLICRKNNRVYIVQCKYWSKQKTIHEKHVNQLLGTTVMYYLQQHNNQEHDIETLSNLLTDKTIVPVFITSTNLSDTAKNFASALGVEVRENVMLEKYPLIKCNINAGTKEKIYHLPFDQQYDKTDLGRPGEFYAWTVQEAEEKGFRRAMRWHGSE